MSNKHENTELLEKAHKLLHKAKRDIGCAWQLIEEMRLTLKKSERSTQAIKNRI